VGKISGFYSLRASAPLREISVMKGTTPAADPVFAAGVTYLCDMTRETNLIKNDALLKTRA
jgi:hypothetical protein